MRLAQCVRRMRIFAAQVDVTLRRADRDAGDGHALDQAERVAFHEHAIGERARVAFVGIADDVFLRDALIEHRLPLDAGRETPRRRGRAGPNRVTSWTIAAPVMPSARLQAGIAVVGEVVIDTDRIDDADACKCQALLLREPGQVFDSTDTRRVRCRGKETGPASSATSAAVTGP